MTAAFPVPRPPRGGAPVGFVEELDEVEAAAVLTLRLWCDGGADRVAADFAEGLGVEAGDRAADALRALCDLCALHARRPLMHHQPACRCLGADEACFANLVATAAFGAREDALLFAMLMLRPDVAPLAVAEAADLGLALRRIALRRARGPLH